nr:odorant receptor 43 [Papilio memnon]
MNDINSGPLKQCFELFTKCYIYFFNNSNSELNKYWKLCCLVPFVILHNFSMLAFLCKIFTEEVNAFEVAYMIPVYLVSLQVDINTFNATIWLLNDREALINNLSILRDSSNLTDRQIKKKKHLTKRLKIYLAMFYWSNILGTWLHLLGPLTSVLFRRFILRQYCELALPFGSVYPYEPTDSWFKYLGTYAFQVYTLMIALCANIAIEFSILREDLLHVAQYFKTDNPRNQMGIGLETNSESNTSSIQDFIRRHQMLIRLAKQLDDIFNKIIFINLLFVTATLCFFGFAITVARGAVETMNNLVAVLALLLPTYTLCYYGELLKDESSGIAESAYINKWYRGDMRYQKMIQFIILRSQRPCCLTSLRHVPVTMTMFTKVLSTTWSYFSLATSIYSRGKSIMPAGK